MSAKFAELLHQVQDEHQKLLEKNGRLRAEFRECQPSLHSQETAKVECRVNVKVFEGMLAKRGSSRGSGANSSLKNAGAQIAARRPSRAEDNSVIAQVMNLARQGMRDANRMQRVAGLEMVMMGGKALVMQEPKIMSEVADLTRDADPEVSQTAYLVLDFLETELSRSDRQSHASPPGSAPSSQLMVTSQSHHGNVSSFSSSARPCTVDYGLLDRLGSFNRRLPGEEAMEVLKSAIVGSDGIGASGRLASKELKKQPGIAREVLPHLSDAVRASREAPIRKAAADTLLNLATGLPKAEGGSGRSVDLETQEEAMDGLSAALRARTNKLLNELADLTPNF
jgi:hypothetical protein